MTQENQVDSFYVTPDVDVDRAMSQSECERKALKALLERPGFSIRARLICGFSFFFMLSAGIAVTALITVERVQHKLRFLEIADSFTNEIQQARRYEKNFFLYRSGLAEALEHVLIAEKLLASGRAELALVIGSKNMETLEGHLRSYEEIIAKLKAHDEPPVSAEFENELRSHGSQMVSLALTLSQMERKKVKEMIGLAKQIPVIFLVFLILLAIYVANFLYMHILRRLKRLMEVTQRISEGDFTPIMPTRRFRDEFTNLAVAINGMMLQLMHRHEIMVRSHKLRAVGTLTAGVAHELNNPINNIMLTAEMLKEDYHDLPAEEQLEMISDLVEQAERAQKIVRNLLSFARESKIQRELFDVGEIVRETESLATNQIKLHKIEFALNLSPNLPQIHGDKQHLSQVFLNLILNAIDSMAGGGKLTINALRAKDPGFIAVEVCDTGNGIPEHIVSRIFDPFFTTKGTGKGTGLGLSVSLGIVRKHGGDIQVRSKLNQGSVFTVLLPISDVPADISDGKVAPDRKM